MNRSVVTTTARPDQARSAQQPAWRELARSSDEQVLEARRHRDRLVAAAVTLVAATDHDPDLATCAAAGCHLADLPEGPTLCAAAHDLANLADAPASTVDATLTPPAALADLRAALVDAADAIRHCRQAEHGTRGCWFSGAPGVDGCGRLLRLLHRCC